MRLKGDSRKYTFRRFVQLSPLPERFILPNLYYQQGTYNKADKTNQKHNLVTQSGADSVKEINHRADQACQGRTASHC
jgi:hypothetical protein